MYGHMYICTISPTFSSSPANYLISNLCLASVIYMVSIIFRRLENFYGLWIYSDNLCNVLIILHSMYRNKIAYFIWRVRYWFYELVHFPYCSRVSSPAHFNDNTGCELGSDPRRPKSTPSPLDPRLVPLDPLDLVILCSHGHSKGIHEEVSSRSPHAIQVQAGTCTVVISNMYVFV